MNSKALQTTTVYLHPTIAACLAKAEQKLGPGEWVDTNFGQHQLVTKLPELRALLADMPKGLMEAIGSDDADVINTWLAERGYQSKLEQFGPDEFGIAAALDVLAKWKLPGSTTNIAHQGTKYPAVLMKEGFTVYDSGVRAVIEPHADVRVLLTTADNLDDGLRALQGHIEENTSVEEVVFPMVDHDAKVDLSWLVGLRYGGKGPDSPALTQVVGQAKLRINERGAHAKAAVAACVSRSCSSQKRRVTIDKPFVIVFMHGTRVMIAFHVTTEAWKQPPDLGEKYGGETAKPGRVLRGGAPRTW